MASLAIVNLMTACDKADNEPTIVSDAPKQALLEQMGVRYDKVVAARRLSFANWSVKLSGSRCLCTNDWCLWWHRLLGQLLGVDIHTDHWR